MRGLIIGVITLIVVGIGVTLYQNSLVQRREVISNPTPTVVQKTMDTTQKTNIKQYDSYPEMVIDPSKSYTVKLTTNKGDVVINTFPQDAPKTVNNFVFLAKDGFYNDTVFHRIISGFMIQGGDPRGNGTGGPGYTFEDEPVAKEYTRGIVAMANAGPNTNGSQFFIMHQDNPLPKNYTIFGEVVEGLDVVDAIASVPVDFSPTGERSVPTEEVKIINASVSEN